MRSVVIWDVDGTLVDSEPLHLMALKTLCARYDVDISSLPDDRFVGVDLYRVWDVLGSRFPRELTSSAWIDELNRVYASGIDRLVPIDDAAMVIARLAEMGVRQAAVSNSNRVVVDANLNALGVLDILEFSISLDDVKSSKPDPEIYLKALDRMHADPSKTISVEDSRTGIMSAHAAGIPVIGLGTKELGADHHISHLRQVLEIVSTT